jgi:hypothetical protein
MLFFSRATRGLGRPSLDARSESITVAFVILCGSGWGREG